MDNKSLNNIYIKDLDNQQINKKNICTIVLINDNMSCYVKFNSKIYLLYLKGVPKKKILKNYFKYLCGNENIYLKILEEKKKFK